MAKKKKKKNNTQNTKNTLCLFKKLIKLFQCSTVTLMSNVGKHGIVCTD